MSKIKHSMMNSEEIQDFLGYDDLRSIKKWCDDHNVPLIKIGKRYMAHSWTIDVAFLKMLRDEACKCGHDGDAVINALVNDDKFLLTQLMDAEVNGETPRWSSPVKNEKGSLDKTLKNYKNKSA